MASSSIRETVNCPVGGRLGDEEELEALLLLEVPGEELELLCAPALEELELASGSPLELELTPGTEDELEPADGATLDELLLPPGETRPLELLPCMAEAELELGALSAEELEELDCSGKPPG